MTEVVRSFMIDDVIWGLLSSECNISAFHGELALIPADTVPGERRIAACVFHFHREVGRSHVVATFAKAVHNSSGVSRLLGRMTTTGFLETLLNTEASSLSSVISIFTIHRREGNVTISELVVFVLELLDE